MKKLARISAVVIIAGLLTGCFSPVQSPSQTKYFFDPDVVSMPSKHTKATLLVSKPAAAPGYATYHMAYIDTPSELAYYTRNRWVAPPAEMLQPLLVDSIQRSQHFGAIAKAPFAGKTRYRLDTELVYIRQNLTTMPHRLELALRVSLVDSVTQQIMVSKTFERSQAVNKLEPYASVVVANTVLAQMLSDVTHFVVINT